MRDSRVPQGPTPTSSDVGRLVALLLVIGGVLHLAGWHLHALVSPLSDLRAYFLPKYQYAADRIANGELPLWNPLEFAGIPFLATVQPGVFYVPARIVYALLDGQRAYDVLFVLHVAFASVATLWLARRLGLGRWPSTFAALWVTQPMWLVQMYDHPMFVFAIAWIPVLVLCVRRAVMAPTARVAIALGAAAALQFFAGYPPYALATGYLLALGVPIWLLEARARGGTVRIGRAAATIAAAGVIATLLAAVQVVPTLELIATSERDAEVLAMHASLSGLAPDFASMFNIPQMTLGASLAELWTRYGPMWLGLAAVALVLGARRFVTWWALGAVVLCAVFPHPWYRVLPFFSFVRFGLEWRCTAPLAVYLLAAVGLDALVVRLQASARTTAVLSALALVAVTGWNWRQVPPHWLQPVDFSVRPVPAWVEAACPIDGDRERMYWLGGQAHAGLFWAGISSLGGQEQGLLPRRTATLARVLGVGNGGAIGHWADQLATSGGLASRASLRCVLAGPAPALRESTFSPIRSQGPLTLYVNEHARPRARLAYEAVVAGSADEALALAEHAVPGAVVLEDRNLPPLETCARTSDGTVTLRSVRPEDVRLEIVTDCPAYLVLADTWFPGWTATIDDRPTTIHRADFAFRAVAVPAGRHAVRFRYAPRSMLLGAALSLLGLLACVGLAGPWTPKRRSARGTEPR